MIEHNKLQIVTSKIVTRTFSDHLFQKKVLIYSFNVHAILMDGSSHNRQFTRLVLKPENACMAKYCISNINNLDYQIAIVQDIKHVLKKICNSLYSSSLKEGSPRQLKCNDKLIVWEHWEEAYRYNM